MTHRKLDEKTLVGPQILVEEVAGLKALGVTLLVNNRPDGEEPHQPASAAIEDAAEQAGIAYRHIPIIRGIGPGDVEEMSEAMAAIGEGKLLAFCRSGTRSALVWALARRHDGASRDEVEQALRDAGMDSTPIAHLL